MSVWATHVVLLRLHGYKREKNKKKSTSWAKTDSLSTNKSDDLKHFSALKTSDTIGLVKLLLCSGPDSGQTWEFGPKAKSLKEKKKQWKKSKSKTWTEVLETQECSRKGQLGARAFSYCHVIGQSSPTELNKAVTVGPWLTIPEVPRYRWPQVFCDYFTISRKFIKKVFHFIFT